MQNMNPAALQQFYQNSMYGFQGSGAAGAGTGAVGN